MHQRRKFRFPSNLTVCLVFLIWPCLRADWPRFRGPDGSGTSDQTGLPIRWSEGQALLWKLKLPGPGSSSPIVAAGRVFVTCYAGYGDGVRRATESPPEDLKRHVVCVDLSSGRLTWDRSLASKMPEAGFRDMGVRQHGYASSTPVSDGQLVVAFFGKTGLVAYDLDGNEKWRADVASDAKTHMFGTASSPIMYQQLVIVPASVECESIVAFEKQTGHEAWRASAAGYGPWWGTPVLATTDGETELLISVPDEIWGLNPENGKLRWYAEGIADRSICPSLVVADGVVYAIGGRRGGAVAVRLGGKGNVTKSHVVWRGTTGSYVPSPVVHEGHVYWINERGIATCLKIESGESVTQKRLEGAESVYASPLVAGGKLYLVTRRSGTLVLEASPELKEVARNTFASDDSDFNASPAVTDGRLLLRSNAYLYCVGSKRS